ncbi:MAG: SUMF1/EgtB/PvdO family nonheme iron enzyme [Treponema sp.]|jgi:hypothetical protein|nr:SUMF1/EgtB/PvdO family nonheme iron enzyme [Treponema sp.]
MFGKNRPPEETLPEDQVKLKPLWGIRPGVYLVWLYGFIILGILFLIFLYPGIAHPGSLLSVSSDPRGAAVRVDGVYMGTAPGDFFVPPGKHKVEMILPGFEPYQTETETGGRFFASLFFPLRKTIRGELGLTRPVEVFSGAAVDYAAWSFAGEPTATYQIPLSLSEGAYQAGPAGADPAVYREFTEILFNALGFTVTRAGLRDLIRAKHLIDNGGLSPSPVTLLRSAGDILNLLSENPEAALWLGDLLPPEAAASLTASSWYNRGEEKIPAAENEIPGRVITLESLNFREIPGGTLIQIKPLPRQVVIEDFSIAEIEISPESWEIFVRARPEWGKENTAALEEQGLVTGDYLEGPDNPEGLSAYPAATVPGVSWYAARAYCQWLTERLPPALSSYEVRLPTEAEWEYAAANFGTALQNMLGGLWEWCGEPFVPLTFFRPPADMDLSGAPLESPEKPVRGGSWVNPPCSVGVETRGSLPPSSCSPFVSFRPVLAPRKTP